MIYIKIHKSAKNTKKYYYKIIYESIYNNFLPR